MKFKTIKYLTFPFKVGVKVKYETDLHFGNGIITNIVHGIHSSYFYIKDKEYLNVYEYDYIISKMKIIT